MLLVITIAGLLIDYAGTMRVNASGFLVEGFIYLFIEHLGLTLVGCFVGFIVAYTIAYGNGLAKARFWVITIITILFVGYFHVCHIYNYEKARQDLREYEKAAEKADPFGYRMKKLWSE